MKFKRLLALGTVLVLSVGTLTANASEETYDPDVQDPVIEEPNEELVNEVDDEIYDDEMDYYEFSVEDFAKYLKDGADVEQIQLTIEQIQQLEEELTRLYDELYSSEDIDWDAYYEDMGFEDDWYDEEFEGPYFTEEEIPEIVEDIAADFKDGLSPEQVEDAKTLIRQALELELEGNFEAAEEKWIQLDEMEVFNWDDFEDYDEDYEDFEDDMFSPEEIPEIVDEIAREFKDDLTPEQVEDAKALIREALQLEIDGDYEAADEKWETLEEMDVFDWDDFEDYDEYDEEEYPED